MKKRFLLVLICVFSALLMCSCGSDTNSDNGKINVVCTAFPQYDWTKSIIEDSENVNLVLLNTKGTDMHSFEPTAKDIITISESDILILVGGEGDKWALDAVKDKNGTTVVNLLEIAEDYGIITDHKHTDSCNDTHAHSGNTTDEHIWMSLKKTAVFTGEICAALCKKDTASSELYQINTDDYVNQILQLDTLFEKTASEAEKNAMVVADRFPFKYLTDDYGIECFAAFPGCSADTDASPDTIIRLSKAVNEHNLKYVAVTENSSGKTAKAVIDNTKEKNQQTIVVDSMQSVSLEDIENGATYIGIMKQNFEAIKKLLETE